MPNFHTQSTDPDIRARFQNWRKTPADHSCRLTLHGKYSVLLEDRFFKKTKTHLAPQKTPLHGSHRKQVFSLVLISFYDLWYMKSLLM